MNLTHVLLVLLVAGSPLVRTAQADERFFLNADGTAAAADATASRVSRIAVTPQADGDLAVTLQVTNMGTEASPQPAVELVLPREWMVRRIDSVEPDPATAASLPYRLDTFEERRRVVFTPGTLPPGGRMVLRLHVMPMRRAPWLAGLLAVLAGLYGFAFRDRLPRRTQAA